MMTITTASAKTGFWIRVLATWIDCIVIYAVLTGVFYLLLFTAPGTYFPFNFTFFITGLVYSIILVAFRGQTIGKYLVGITVRNHKGQRLRFWSSILRESVLKFFSAIAFFLGFFWIGFSKKKKAWHDYLVRSEVLQIKGATRRIYFWRLLSFVSLVFFFIIQAWTIAGFLIEVKKMSINTDTLVLPFMQRNPSELTDVSAVKDSSFSGWLDKNALPAKDYTLQVAASHQVTLLGEQHEDADNLNFLKNLIYPLYHQSGVRVIAMEAVPASMNKKLAKLVNGNVYDSALALEIAQSQGWHIWGWKEYWDVPYTVWQLNHSLPLNAERMRLVGIDDDENFADVALSMGSVREKKPAFWERFRIVSSIPNIFYEIYRDQFMARVVEKEIILKNKKGVVLIGSDHAMLNHSPFRIINGKVQVHPRFGVLLNQKYPGRIFQIMLGYPFNSDQHNSTDKSSIDHFMDSLLKKKNYMPIGFTVTASPFEKLRDSSCTYWSKLPSVCYGDVVQGIVFLKPIGKRNQCSWMEGYVSDEMYMRYKPLYKLFANPKMQFSNAREMNQLFLEHVKD